MGTFQATPNSKPAATVLPKWLQRPKWLKRVLPKWLRRVCPACSGWQYWDGFLEG
ncbi:hypothetical protein T484DRAFT_1925214 [Baffinella frigidus]|nr:hypothetical protein T484DRAFT_1925214 [Cryptophyta sp. CCMP2293]